jgi:hypothetical protein
MAGIDWLDTANWGHGRVHIGTTDDLGDHGRHCDEADQ